jgi:hypothetical protein
MFTRMKERAESRPKKRTLYLHTKASSVKDRINTQSISRMPSYVLEILLTHRLRSTNHGRRGLYISSFRLGLGISTWTYVRTKQRQPIGM